MYNTSSGYRKLKEGGEKYDTYFPLHEKTETIMVKRFGNLDDSIELIKDTSERYKYQTAKIAPILKGETLEKTCRNIWAFCYSFIQYKLDEEGAEQVRKPVRSWKDRHTGIDCDCFSVFVSSILLNLGISHRFKITDYGRGFQHIYVIVPHQNKNYIIDAVLPAFNIEKKPIVNSKFIDMRVELLGNPGTDKDKQLLEKQLFAMRSNPHLFEEHFDVNLFIEQGQNLLNNWEDESYRNQLFESISSGLSGFEDDSELDDDGLGILKKGGRPKPNQRGAKAPVRRDAQPTKGGKGKATKNTKTFFKNLKNKISGGDGKIQPKDILHSVTRFSPVTVVMRNAFLLLLKLKFAKRALAKLYALPDKSHAEKLEKWYYAAGGKPEKLREAAQGKLSGLDGLGEAVTATVSTVAAPMVLEFLKILHDSGILKKQPPGSPEDLGNWLKEAASESGDGGDEAEFQSQDVESYSSGRMMQEEAKTEEGGGGIIQSIMENKMLVIGLALLLLFIMFKSSGNGLSGLDGLDGTKKRKKVRRRKRKTLGDVTETEDDEDGLGATRKRKRTAKAGTPKAKPTKAKRKTVNKKTDILF